VLKPSLLLVLVTLTGCASLVREPVPAVGPPLVPADTVVVRRVDAASQGLWVDLPGAVHFAFDATTITPDQEPGLERVATLLRTRSDLHLRLAGHADARGASEYNLGLAGRRAYAILVFLTERGAPDERITLVSYGAGQPQVPGDTNEAHAANRRVEILFQFR
jgi:outer membrane protein OmpA-like peptidoglycan-associated protein